MRLYAEAANKEATRIDYKYGIAKSLLHLVNSKLFLQIKDSISKINLQQVIQLGEKLKNDSIIGLAYYALAGFGDQAANYKKAILYLNKAGNVKTVGEIYTWLTMVYTNKGEYEEGLEYAEKSLDLTMKNANDDWGYKLVQWSMYNLAELYKAAGDYENAMEVLRKARHYGEPHNLWNMDDQIGILLALMNKPDSSLYYLQNFKKNAPFNQLGADMFIGETYLTMQEYDKAAQLFHGVVDSLKKSKAPFLPFITKGLINLGKAYAGEQKYKTALKYATEGFRVIQNFSDPQFVMDVYKLLSGIYHHVGEDDSAYVYLERYTTLKDSIQNKQFLWRLNNRLNNYKRQVEETKKESKIRLLDKDNKIKQQQLKEQATFRKFLLALFAVLVLAVLYIYRNLNLKRKNERLLLEHKEQQWKLTELENEKKHTELQRLAAELEMQALRAQMNPHFIFNCLSAINRIILRNESKIASDYLTRFSRLIRMVLINSQKTMIPLEDELQMLRLYLDMERLRFKNSFDYTISFTNAIDTGAVLIPSLLLQPFCENAVWHGLMQKEGQGHLTIELSKRENILHCVITDDGIGRERAGQLKSKTAEMEKSMGLEITAQRLALLNGNNDITTFFTIEDVTDISGNITGTRVILKICYKELIEELV